MSRQVKVAFVNDDGPRNLYVDKIVVGGVIYETEAPTTYSTGTWSSGTGCDDDYKQSEGLGCNGYFQYSVRVQRTTYSLAGQAIGLRIVGNPDGDNGLYYMHTDHLGSTSTLSYLADDGTADVVPEARALYEPFGDYRLEPTGDYTDRGYTGHLGNNSGSNDIGLIYMNAHFYVPGIARFASADTIVADPANLQSLNRYSYVRNNPVNKIDPTGHVDCSLLGDSGDTQGCNDAKPTPPRISKPDPPCTDVWCTIARPSGIKDSTWEKYQELYNQLLAQNSPYILSDGRIDDQYLVALLIDIEIDRSRVQKAVFNSALEAVSNQYHGWGCHGGCSSLSDQLTWMDAMQNWWDRDSPFPQSVCPTCMDDAAKAVAGYNDGDGLDAVWWGNPLRESELNDFIVTNYSTVPKWGLLEATNRYIVGYKGTNDGGAWWSAEFYYGYKWATSSLL